MDTPEKEELSSVLSDIRKLVQDETQQRITEARESAVSQEGGAESDTGLATSNVLLLGKNLRVDDTPSENKVAENPASEPATDALRDVVREVVREELRGDLMREIIDTLKAELS